MARRSRRPKESVLYRVVRDHLATLLEVASRRIGMKGLPAYVRQEFERDLDCGILANGFIRVRCPARAPRRGPLFWEFPPLALSHSALSFLPFSTVIGWPAISNRRNGPMADDRRASPSRTFLLVAASIVAAVTGGAVALSLPALLGLFAGVNVATIALYGYDKAVAGGSRLRVPENVLHLLAFVGGSPAALLGQSLFRHKTVKPAFRRRFWLIVVAQLAILTAAGWILLRPPSWLPEFLRLSGSGEDFRGFPFFVNSGEIRGKTVEDPIPLRRKDMGMERRLVPQAGWFLGILLAAAIVPACGPGSSSSKPGSPPPPSEDTVVPASAGSLVVGPSYDFVPLYDGRVLLGDRTTSRINLVNVVTGLTETFYQLSAAPGDLEYDATRNYLYATLSAATQLARIDLTTGQVVNIPISAAATDLALGNNGIVFASLTTSYYGPIGVVDGPGGTQLKTLTGPAFDDFPSLIVYDRANDVLIAGTPGLSPSTLTRYAYDPAAMTLTEVQSVWNTGSNGQELVLSPDGLHLAFPNGAGNGVPSYTIFDYDPTNLTVTYGAWDTGAYPRAAAWSLDSQRVLASNGTELELFNSATHASIQVYPLDFSACSYYQIMRVGVSRGGKIGYGFSNCGFNDDSGRLYWVLLPP